MALFLKTSRTGVRGDDRHLDGPERWLGRKRRSGICVGVRGDKSSHRLYTCRLILVLGKEDFPPLLGLQSPPGRHFIQKNSSLSPGPQVLSNLFLAGRSGDCSQSVDVSLGVTKPETPRPEPVLGSEQPPGAGELHADGARKGVLTLPDAQVHCKAGTYPNSPAPRAELLSQ